MIRQQDQDGPVPETSKRNPLRISRVVGDVSLEHAPVVHDRLDVLPAVGSALYRYGVSAHHRRRNLVAVCHQRHGSLVDLIAYLQTYARVAGHVPGPELVVREGRLHAAVVRMGMDMDDANHGGG